MGTTKVNLRRPEIYTQFILLASFDSNPYEDNQSVAINIDVTKQELDNLFNTKQYERPHEPDYYNPLDELIGELYTEQSKETILKLITDKVNKYIPRITINSSLTEFTFENYAINMSLVFSDKYDYEKTLYNYERKFNVVT